MDGVHAAGLELRQRMSSSQSDSSKQYRVASTLQVSNYVNFYSVVVVWPAASDGLLLTYHQNEYESC